jgi:multiple sugar transport system ATP-binding protein
MVFQSYALYPHMSVFDNMAFGLRMRKYSRDEIDGRVRQAATALGIDALLQRRPGELSGGQQQRVALGRAIVRQPRAYLMDEPLSNLDAKMRVQMRAELVRLHREMGTTFIYVTHDQVEAMTMGGRVAVLEKGVLQQTGAPQEVYDRPANLFVAEFIGSPAMNFFETRVERSDGRVALRNDDASFLLPDALAGAVAGSESVVVGVRPEHLEPEAGADAAATLAGTVDLVESLGSEAHVIVAMPHGSLTVRLPAGVRLDIGAPLRLGVRAEHLHLYDKASGRRIDA